MAKDIFEIKTPFSATKNPGKRIKDWYGPKFVEVLCNELEIASARSFIKAFKKLFYTD